MKYIFRGHTIFEYDPKIGRVLQHKILDTIPGFDYCLMIAEDYKLLSEYFDKVYKHTQGQEVDMKDIEVY